VTGDGSGGTFIAGDSLGGQNSWSVVNVGGNANPSSVQSIGTGLTNAGMNGEVAGSINNAGSSNLNDGVRITGPATGTDNRMGNGEMWFAGLLAVNDDDADWVYLSYQFDSDGNAFNAGAGNGPIWEYNNGLDVTIGAGDTQYVQGETALLVGRLVNSNSGTGDETIDLWFNPTDASSAASLTSTADASQSFAFDAITGSSWGEVTVGAVQRGSTTDLSFDELRVGDTLADLNLSVIPEPSSLLLLGAGVGTLVFLRLRRARKDSSHS